MLARHSGRFKILLMEFHNIVKIIRRKGKMLGLELRLKGLKVRFITDPTNDISIMSNCF